MRTGPIIFLSPRRKPRCCSKRGGGSPAAFQIVHFTDMPPGNRRYLMCSRKVSPDLIARFNEALGREESEEPDSDGGDRP